MTMGSGDGKASRRFGVIKKTLAMSQWTKPQEENILDRWGQTIPDFFLLSLTEFTSSVL